ncbi:c6 zinc finger domain containing protein [Grosmannia clavigera kw1407]|uniref:C6 zinc finger domain containing protein n=1 Tax=Grosmannia clavigera (strain kw1407 / UAMH 11150) TaxID=655863 RepID=F0X8V1_GROCL|nr:c6 zinc finger domain containing protein [Grosmannia clavigera kw1407]EFX06130.1 c6 zinc finger domain containing protein [Grosmannia clavigera kw1407]
MSVASSATASTANPSGQRKRRGKKNSEKKDGSASFTTTGSDGASVVATNAAGKVIKRRAARACVSCRNRKVRCDVVETFPCGNCRWDKIECVVQEGRRRRRGLFNARETAGVLQGADAFRSHNQEHGHDHEHDHDHSHGSVNGSISSVSGFDFSNAFGGDAPQSSVAASGNSFDTLSDNNLPFPCVNLGNAAYGGNALLLPKTSSAQQPSADPAAPSLNLAAFPLLPLNGLLGDPQQQASALLPGFISPLPGKMAPEDVVYLHSKGAFTLPDETLQRALLHAYVEFVHPYMPLLELNSFLQVVSSRDGSNGTISLLLYHAVMFAAASFVPAKYLKAVGFSRRREARKTFFMKARALYDFDYETDRLTLVQALLLMTYWYETPDDQKDTWHWMGVAVSLAHTIGLHRDPRTTGEPLHRQRLRKLNSGDADVPMLAPVDFEKTILPDSIDSVPTECRLVRDLEMQEKLAELCVEKAKLCVLVGNMLHQQYTILPRGRQRSADSAGSNSTMMLFPNRPVNEDGQGNGPSVVDKIDAKLRAWLLALPPSCRYAALTPADVQNGRATIAVQRTLLHLVYHTTMSALHRPRIQPVGPGSPMLPIEQQEFSRARVRDAANCVTRMGGELLRLRLESYLPTAGVTVFLPAMFAHLLDIKGGVPRERRQQAVYGFLTCMRIMESLRETYAAAEIAKGFVESLLKKAGIDLSAVVNFGADGAYGINSGHSGNSGNSCMSAEDGTGTPINGTSVSLLNATSNVAVPYTEDGVAHAVSVYAATTPKATAHPMTPADNNIANADSSPAYRMTPAAKSASRDAQQNCADGGISATAASSSSAGSAASSDVGTASASSTNHMSVNASMTGVDANSSNEQMCGLTPLAGAASEDPFEWDVAVADPNSMKLDFDQWLDFPPEGMGSSTDHAFLFNNTFGNESMQQPEY